jgi:hypothetical protein
MVCFLHHLYELLSSNHWEQYSTILHMNDP